MKSNRDFRLLLQWMKNSIKSCCSSRSKVIKCQAQEENNKILRLDMEERKMLPPSVDSPMELLHHRNAQRINSLAE
ncbi:CLUMA_CG013671, isoform A [Clunio marinus]|uniref:CLUMA_CG013671, isoform A n=1 Tax=Clunio marinus TaxID=568069 RepID=A0A1J1ILG2_9DIPT|nr:CLUMA_CG013671, isoform A [Clunio marinus]